MVSKKEIPNSEDWSTNTNNPMINGFRDFMKESNKYQDDAMVGLFWYDVENDELFGVNSVIASDINFYDSEFFKAPTKSISKLHYAVWQKECNKGKDKRFQAVYTTVPRGRVFEIQDKGFIVCVGTWIKDYPSAKNLILDEFQLPNDTEFIIDSHWNIGHGWSDKKF